MRNYLNLSKNCWCLGKSSCWCRNAGFHLFALHNLPTLYTSSDIHKEEVGAGGSSRWRREVRLERWTWHAHQVSQSCWYSLCTVLLHAGWRSLWLFLLQVWLSCSFPVCLSSLHFLFPSFLSFSLFYYCLHSCSLSAFSPVPFCAVILLQSQSSPPLKDIAYSLNSAYTLPLISLCFGFPL